MNAFYENKRVLVTGVCGTVGKELTRQLLADHKVGELVGLDNNESELFFLEQAFSKYDHANFFLADVRDLASRGVLDPNAGPERDYLEAKI